MAESVLMDETKSIEQDLAAIIADLDFHSYYQLLDADESASLDVITYQHNLKVYELEQVKRRPGCSARLLHDVVLLLDRLDEARQVLCNEELRAAYDRGLELGQTRHEQTAVERSRRVDPDLRGIGQDDTHLERVTRELERQLPRELLHEDAPTEPDQPPLDRSELEQLTASMSAKLARAGIELRVRDDFDQQKELSPIDADYLHQAVDGLGSRLDRLGVDLADDGEEEDRSADAGFADEMVQQLQAELAAMGLDMFDVAEVVDVAPEEELLDEEGRPAERPALQAPVEAPGPGAPQLPPLGPELTVDIDRLLQPEQEEPEELYDERIPVEEGGGPVFVPAAAPRAATPGSAPDLPEDDEPVPVILLDEDEE